MDKFVYSPKEASAYIGLGENMIRSLCASGRIKAARSGPNWKIPRPLLEEFILEQARKGARL